jgi:hypothetical protein
MYNTTTGSNIERFPSISKDFALPLSCLALPLLDKVGGKLHNWKGKLMTKATSLDLPLLDKVGGKLPNWKGKLMTKATRVQVVKSMLTSVITYHDTIFNLPKWLIKKIDKLKRNFFWKGDEGEGNKGGACLVKWGVVCKPKELGGLGIHDLKHFGIALRQRWFWYH